MKHTNFRTEFVEFVPEDLEEGVLYVSMRYTVAVHDCFCGCGWKTVTPLGRDGWHLRFDGRVSLQPSIGNHQYPCRSHYWLTDDTVQWL